MTEAADGDEVGLGMAYEYFDAMYAHDDDPWGFDTSWYERRKYRISLSLLPRERYRRALEAGCSIGSFTQLLADRCDALVAFDFHTRSVDTARRRMSDDQSVDVLRETFPSYWPDGGGDLVIWSEVAYYLDEAGARGAIEGLTRWLEPGGDLLAVHYTGETNYPRTGRAITEWLDAVPFLERLILCVDSSFEAGVWRRSA